MAAAALLIGAGTLASCNDSKQDTKPAAKADKVAAKDNLPNYRYVDLDTVLAKYALAKDYNEEMMRMQSSMESTMRTHEKRLQSQAAVMQNKMNNNGYLTRESYEQDQSSLNSMHVNDSINAFIEEYNKSRGYDAIFFKAATLYINPALDVTDEVVEGLNARYNKLKK